MSEAALKVDGLTKRFGGLVAVDDVSLEVNFGALHAVIGPNGAGKSTLINLLSGDLRTTAGRTRLNGRDISSCSPDQRSRLGMGRSYQKTNIFLGFSVFENCRLAAQSREPHALNWLRGAKNYSSVIQAAERALATVGLQARAEAIAANLSHGEQRQLEIAMTLATSPRVLLLDEPLAGMDAEESSRMIQLLQAMAKNHAILLVEHDMDAVFALAQTMTVMVNGRVMASGTPDQIRSNPEVQRAYLGNPEGGGRAQHEHPGARRG
jgi:branched-chain amino acid transport system ATP-binding protein